MPREHETKVLITNAQQQALLSLQLAPCTQRVDRASVELNDTGGAGFGPGHGAPFTTAPFGLGEKHDLLPDRCRACLKVDVGPPQSERFAATPTCGRKEMPRVTQPVPRC